MLHVRLTEAHSAGWSCAEPPMIEIRCQVVENLPVQSVTALLGRRMLLLSPDEALPVSDRRWLKALAATLDVETIKRVLAALPVKE